MNGILYSWFDVDFEFQQRRANSEWPLWLVDASAYQDGLTLRVRVGTPAGAITSMMRGWFGPRYDPEKGLFLEATPNTSRISPITVEEVADETSVARRVTMQPTFRRVALFPQQPASVDWPAPFSDGSPVVTAFYSFKGGVGRTTHLLAYVLALASRAKPLRTLIVDADLEAPGITSLLHAEKNFAPPEFSFVDLLALAQSDPDENFKTALSIAAYALRKQTIPISTSTGHSEHYVLPAFRTPSQTLSLDIRPEHLIATPSTYWKLGDLFARLGRLVEADAVVIDLRAGISELASPLLFDPRLRRVIVTTPSRQSVDGTLLVLEQVAKLAPPLEREDLFDPTLILSFVTPELAESGAVEQLSAGFMDSYPDTDLLADFPKLRIDRTGFAQELLYLNSISDAITKLAPTNVTKVMTEAAQDIAAQLEFPSAVLRNLDLENVRRRLETLSTDLEYAESGRGDRFLRISPIRNLGRQFAEVPPVAVVVGSKGAGKTYTCLQILRTKLWSTFAGVATGEKPLAEWGLLWPIFQSKNLKESAKLIVDECVASTVARLGISAPLSSIALEDTIQESLRHSVADETWWRHRWFKLIADSLGLEAGSENECAGRIIDFLRSKEQRVVLVFDGLEDLFPVLETKEVQQTALRALLQGVPNYLRQVPNCPLGIIIFVRRDLAQVAIPQNFGQFLRLYDSFQLLWNGDEALRLAVWLVNEAGVPLEQTAGKPVELMTPEEAKLAMVPAWGRKLGPDNSREARSAEWVIAALSDFRGQIQARDLVRFFRYAASVRRSAAITDRVLAPRAIRDAIAPCSKEKIEEIKQEIPQLKNIFTRLQQSTNRRIPFDAATSGLSVEEIHFLESVGVLIEDRGEYFMPEIFRLGLGIQLATGARPRVLSLARRSVG
jgi:MinD-like ATPase involved in chromosome partitioning or flagellar assembly